MPIDTCQEILPEWWNIFQETTLQKTVRQKSLARLSMSTLKNEHGYVLYIITFLLRICLRYSKRKRYSWISYYCYDICFICNTTQRKVSGWLRPKFATLIYYWRIPSIYVHYVCMHVCEREAQNYLVKMQTIGFRSRPNIRSLQCFRLM